MHGAKYVDPARLEFRLSQKVFSEHKIGVVTALCGLTPREARDHKVQRISLLLIFTSYSKIGNCRDCHVLGLER